MSNKFFSRATTTLAAALGVLSFAAGPVLARSDWSYFIDPDGGSYAYSEEAPLKLRDDYKTGIIVVEKLNTCIAAAYIRIGGSSLTWETHPNKQWIPMSVDGEQITVYGVPFMRTLVLEFFVNG